MFDNLTFLNPRENQLFSFMQVVGYFDASGTHTNKDERGNYSPALVVAGYLATKEQWKRFDERWRKHLREHKIKDECFHLTDFSARKGQYQNWDEPVRHEFFKKLVAIISENVSFGIAMSLSLADFNRIIEGEVKQIFGFAHPLHYVTLKCFESAIDWAIANKYDDAISYIFESGDDFQHEILSTHAAVNKDEELSRYYRFETDALVFSSKKKYTPLQAADVLANEVYKEEYRSLYTKQYSKTSWAVLASIQGEYKHFNEKHLNKDLEKLILKFEEMKKAS